MGTTWDPLLAGRPARYTVVHSRTVAVLFVDTRPVDAIAFRHGLLSAADVAGFFRLPGSC